MSNLFPLHNQQVQNLGAPPEVPKLLKQSQDRMLLYPKLATGLIAGVDITITRVNTVLQKLTPNSIEFIKLSKYMQRCIDHKNRLIQVLELLAKEEILSQKFYGFWIEGKDIPDFTSQQSTPVQNDLPIGQDGKPVGTVRADGAIDITGKSTTLPINGVLTLEQAKELGVVGTIGPVVKMPVVNGGGVITPEQQKAYIQAEEAVKGPAINVGGNGVGQNG